MVYVISTDSDNSTSDVIEWLFKLKKSFLRIGNFIDTKDKLDFFPIQFFNSNSNGDKSDLRSIWIRQFSRFNDIDNHNLQWYYWNESKVLSEFIFHNR